MEYMVGTGKVYFPSRKPVWYLVSTHLPSYFWVVCSYLSFSIIFSTLKLQCNPLKPLLNFSLISCKTRNNFNITIFGGEGHPTQGGRKRNKPQSKSHTRRQEKGKLKATLDTDLQVRGNQQNAS